MKMMYTIINEQDAIYQKKGLYTDAISISYTTLENLHLLYNYGSTLGNYNAFIKAVKVPDDALVIENDLFNNNIKRSDKLILRYEYPLYDMKTLKHFNIKITKDYINVVCILNKVDILKSLKKCNKEFEYDHWAMDYASYYDSIEVLEWWKHSELPLKYSKNALEFASAMGYIRVLDWWRKSGLTMIYDNTAVDHAVLNGKIEVLKWWVDSGLPLKYSEDVHNTLVRNYEVIKWWKYSGLSLS